MIYDATPSIIADGTLRFRAVQKAEQRAEQARRAKLWDQVREAENQARELRPYLLRARPGLAYHEEVARNPNHKSKLPEIWHRAALEGNELPDQRLNDWELTEWFERTFTAPLTIESLPSGSFSITFDFELHTPYLSGGDEGLYPIDNPIRIDHVFMAPMVAPTSWKGSLRAALRDELGQRTNGTDNRNAVESTLNCFFGSLSTVPDVNAREGWLHFFPTFFRRMNLEVISPQDRGRETGRDQKSPIFIECVPSGTIGRFQLLYLPFDQMGDSEARRLNEMLSPLTLIGRGIHRLFTVSGFGAKTSSGYGLAEDKLPDPGCVTVQMPGSEPASQYFSALSALARASEAE